MSTLIAVKNNSKVFILPLLVIFAVFFRSYQEYLLADFPPDKRIQTATALNFANGKGIAIAYADAEDLSKTEYKKIGLWPPGFPVATAIFMGLGFTPFQSSYILEVIAISVLFLSLWGIFKLLEGEIISWIPVCFIIFQTFTLGIYKVSFTNDLISLSFSVFAFFLFLKILQGDYHRGVLFLFGLVSFVPSFFRFSYYPVSLLFPILLLFYALFCNKKYLEASLIALAFTGGLIGLQLFYQSTLPIGLSYLDEYHPEAFSKPYWNNLRMFVDLPIEMFTNKYLFKRSLDQINPLLFLIMRGVAWLLFIAAVLGLCLRMILDMKKEGKSYFLNPKNQFLSGGLLVCFAVLGFLVLLSLRYPPEEAGWMPGNVWTYVAEARYFNLVLILFPLLLTTGFQDLFTKKWIRFSGLGIIAIFFTFSFFTGLYYCFKYSGNSLKENSSIYYHYHQEIEDYLKSRQSASGNEQLLFTPAKDNGNLGIYASLLQIPLLKLTAIEGGMKTQSPVCILLNLNDSQSPETKKSLQKVISEHQLEPVKEFPCLEVKLYELCIP